MNKKYILYNKFSNKLIAKHLIYISDKKSYVENLFEKAAKIFLMRKLNRYCSYNYSSFSILH